MFAATVEKKKLIIDTDPGIDDAVAILAAFGCQDFEVIGLTTIHGNVDVDVATENALRLLKQFHRPTVPVCRGMKHGWSGVHRKRPVHIHGETGTGNVDLPESDVEMHATMTANEFIVEMCNLYPNQVSILCLGPLTNLAEALVLDAQLPLKWDYVVALGGAFFVNGNVNPVAEANIASDPDAADFVVQSAGNIRFVGLDITAHCILTKSDLDEIALFHQSGKLIRDMFAFYTEGYASRCPKLGGAPPHDAVALMALIDPTLFDWVHGPIRVATSGMCQGQTVLSTNEYNERNPWSGAPTSSVAVSGKTDIIISRIKCLLKKAN